MIKQGSPDQIKEMFMTMNSARENIIENVISLVYFMRGAIQYSDMMLMSHVEKQAISNFIKQRLEMEKDKMYPIY